MKNTKILPPEYQMQDFKIWKLLRDNLIEEIINRELAPEKVAYLEAVISETEKEIQSFSFESDKEFEEKYIETKKQAVQVFKRWIGSFLSDALEKNSFITSRVLMASKNSGLSMRFIIDDIYKELEKERENLGQFRSRIMQNLEEQVKANIVFFEDGEYMAYLSYEEDTQNG